MKRAWSTLPREILQIVFNILNESSTVEPCTAVCKGWLLPAREELYRKVELTLDQLELFIEAIEHSPNQLGKRVQTFIFIVEEQFRSTGGLFSQFIDLCPNVKEFESKDMPDELWLELSEAIKTGKWNNLKRIPSPDDIFNLNSYTDIALKCEKLESITLLLWTNLSEENDGYVKKLAKNLNKFKFLNHLNLQTFAVYLDISMLELFVKIEDCLSLKSISFYPNYRSVVLPAVNESIDTTLIIPTPNIFSFRGHFILSENSLRYFTHKFPGLNTLELDLVVKNYFSGLSQLKSFQRNILFDEFLEYISKIEMFTLNFIDFPSPSNLITRYFNSSCNCYKKVNVRFSGINSSRINRYTEIIIEKTTKMKDLLSGEEVKMTGITTPISAVAENVSLIPGNNVAQYFGSDITELHFSLPIFTLALDVKKVVELNLKNALEHCSGMKTLILTNITIPNFEESVSPESFETIIFNLDLNDEVVTFVRSWDFVRLKYVSIFLNISKDIYCPNFFRYHINLRGSKLENISFNATIRENAVPYNNFSKVCIDIICHGSGLKDSFVIDGSGMRKLNEKELYSISNSSGSSVCCLITIICAGIKSFTCDTRLDSSHSPTTYIIDSYK